MIQGGSPNSKDDDRMNDGTGGRAGKYFGDETDDYVGREDEPSTWTIPAEFNDSLHVKGTLSMAIERVPFTCSESLNSAGIVHVEGSSSRPT